MDIPWRAIVEFTFALIYIVAAVLIGNVEVYHRQGFWCGDQDLMRPSRSDTVPMWILMLCSCGVAPVMIVGLCLIIPEKTSCILKRISVYFFCGGLLYLCISVTKWYSGQLRPDFFDVCQPDWSNIDCSSFVQSYNCTRKDADALQNVRLRFPSGHAAVATFSIVSLIYFMQTAVMETKWREQFLVVLLMRSIQIFLGLLDVLVCVSRVFDNKHLPFDVISGALLGFAMGVSNIIWMRSDERIFVCQERKTTPEENSKKIQ